MAEHGRFGSGADSRRGKGGKREGSGAKSVQFMEEVKKIGDPLKVIQFFYDVSQGAELEQVVTDTGETVRVPASVKDRIRAGEAYLERTIGKVKEQIEMSGSVNIISAIKEAREKRGLNT